MSQLRRIAAVTVAAVSVAAASGCGGSNKPAYCKDRDNLEQSIKDLKNIDVTKAGVSGVQAQLQKVQTDAQTLAQSAKSEFAPQSAALKSSVSELASAVRQAASSPSAQSITAVTADVSKVGTAFQDLSAAVSKKC